MVIDMKLEESDDETVVSTTSSFAQRLSFFKNIQNNSTSTAASVRKSSITSYDKPTRRKSDAIAKQLKLLESTRIENPSWRKTQQQQQQTARVLAEGVRKQQTYSTAGRLSPSARSKSPKPSSVVKEENKQVETTQKKSARVLIIEDPTSQFLRNNSSSGNGSRDEETSSEASKDTNNNDEMTRENEIKSTTSIKDRMKLLQKNSDESWRKKVARSPGDNKLTSLTERMNRLKKKENNNKNDNETTATNTTTKARASMTSQGAAATTSSTSSTKVNTQVQDRLNAIISNSEQWKKKKGKQNDAAQFTVKSKMSKTSQNIREVKMSPIVRRRDVALPTNGKPVVTVDDVADKNGSSLGALSFVQQLKNKGLEENVIKKSGGNVKEIPKFADDEFENFFQTPPTTTTTVSTTSTLVKRTTSRGNGFTSRKSSSHDEISSLSSASSLSDVDSLISLSDHDEEDEDVISDIDVDEKVSPPQDDGEFTYNETIDELVVQADGNLLVDTSKLEQRRRLKLSRSQKPKSRKNPLKTLAARTDLQTSYTEQRSNITTLEQQRLAVIRGNASFTSSALAGLASRADLSKVQLRSTKSTSAFKAKDEKPWKELMLLRVKGRKHVQTRLVEPSASSISSDDAYLLIKNPDKMYAWFGQYSNVIEKAKVQEIADYIIHKGDLGCKAKSSLTIYNEGQKAEAFWKLLGGCSDDYDRTVGGDEEDERYEISAESTIKSYTLNTDNQLVPYTASWGRFPNMGMLTSDSTFVFDFGAEMYIWQGKEVSFENRQLAVTLARALWEKGYDYEDSKFCPFHPISRNTENLTGPRPEWGLFARVNENLETSLVQEKFEDWSNIMREIGDREELLRETNRGEVLNDMSTKASMKPDMSPYDVIKMKSSKSRHRPINLEGHDLWHGNEDIYDIDGRGLKVKRKDLKVWFANGKEIEEDKDNEDLQIFYKSETYVVRWRYNISSTGKFSAQHADVMNNDVDHYSSEILRQRASSSAESQLSGRDRTNYFLWKGNESSVNEQGVSALLTSDLDKDSNSQVMINEGNEPPLFSKLFAGNLMVVDGKRASRCYEWKLFLVRGSSLERGYLYQVPCKVRSLRSTTCFVFLNVRKGRAIVWKGCKSNQISHQIANHFTQKIKTSRLKSLGYRMRTAELEIENIVEGEEESSTNFKDALSNSKKSKEKSTQSSKKSPKKSSIMFLRRDRYRSMLKEPSTSTTADDNNKVMTVKAWHMTSSGDEFIAKPLELTTDRGDDDDVTNAFPYSRDQLKELPKPALVMVENYDGVYLWESCSHDNEDEELKGSTKRQHDIMRRLAIETCINYIKEHRKEGCEGLLIPEGSEPINFTNSFDIWIESETNDRYARRKENVNRAIKKPKEFHDVINSLTRLIYTIAELKADKLPEGVDPNQLETYLSLQDFVDTFKMQKEEFYQLPAWKQLKLRRDNGLY